MTATNQTPPRRLQVKATRTEPYVIERQRGAEWVPALPFGRSVRSGIDDDEAREWFASVTRRCRKPYRLVRRVGLGSGTLLVVATHLMGVPAAKPDGGVCPLALTFGRTRAPS
ncbi:hypothetical protein [Rhodanobacter sp. FW106-PBR-LB-2-11]|uniref:hypothetical protein n=1 Tax=Rhodanobacter sp. FW106-PBR-LB-2-11 TaxID=1524463 RepID=UPI0034E51C0B